MDDMKKMFFLLAVVALFTGGILFLNNNPVAETEQRYPITFKLVNDLNSPVYVVERAFWGIAGLTDIFGPVSCGCICVGCPIYQRSISDLPPVCKEITQADGIEFTWDRMRTIERMKVCSGISIKKCSEGVYVKNGNYKINICYSLGCNRGRLDAKSTKCAEKEFLADDSSGEVRIYLSDIERRNNLECSSINETIKNELNAFDKTCTDDNECMGQGFRSRQPFTCSVCMNKDKKNQPKRDAVQTALDTYSDKCGGEEYMICAAGGCKCINGLCQR